MAHFSLPWLQISRGWPLERASAKCHSGEGELARIFLTVRSHPLCQAFKHIFTSPSSVEREAKATRSGNARIHGMTRVTPASVAYAATQVGSFKLDSLSISGYPLGQVFSHILTSFHPHRHCDRLWTILQQYPRPPRGPWGDKRGGWPTYLVESVRFIITTFNSLHSYTPSRQVFPNYTAVSRPVSKDSALAKIKAKRAAQKQGLTEQRRNV
jgi:hypothetical protein